MGETLSEKRVQDALEAKPLPVPRTSQLQPSTPGLSDPAATPEPKPTAGPSVEDLQKQITDEKARADKAETEVAERLRQNALKDEAIAELRAKVTPPAPPPEDEPDEDRQARIAKAAAEAAIKGAAKDLAPLLDAGRKALAERERADAVVAFGAENVTKYEAEAQVRRQQHPTESLAEALKVIMPVEAFAPKEAQKTETPPSTHVEGSQPPPEGEKSKADQYTEHVQRARTLRRGANDAAADRAWAKGLQVAVPFNPRK